MKARQEALRNVVYRSLLESWHPAKLTMFARLSGEVGRLDVLVEIATEELFHEMGAWPEVEAYLEQGAQDGAVPPDQRLKALDALAFASMKAGSHRTSSWLDQMDALIKEYNLGSEERLRVGMKRMNFLAGNGDSKGAELLIANLKPVVKRLSPGHQRVFSYSVACAHLSLNDAAATIKLIEPLIEEYYDLIGLTPKLVMGKNAPDLAPMLKAGSDVDDIKHLADSLDVLAKASDAECKFSPIARVHALKFYDLARAPDSLFRVGQDLIDQFLGKRDFDGALSMMETIVLPQLRQWKLADYLVSVRSQYAVVLAYCGRYSDAEAEMDRLNPYKSGLQPLAQRELENQQDLIADLRRLGPPPKWVPPPDLLQSIALEFGKDAETSKMSLRSASRKIGRNEQCPCGSGKKYKKCHG